MELSIVIYGWHFHNEHLYRELINETQRRNELTSNCFIASHKKNEEK